MPRSRNIKFQFFGNEHLAELSPHARLLFIALWCLADCKGRLEDRPKKIKAFAFPFESVDIDALLTELLSSPDRFITRYEVEGQRYLEILNFSSHQRPSTKEKEAGSRIPPRSLGDVPGSDPGTSPMSPQGEKIRPWDSLITDVLITETLKPNGMVSKETSSVSECVSENQLQKETDRLAKEGMAYFASLNSPNHMNLGWVKGYLGIELTALAQSRRHLGWPAIMAAWRDTCDLAVQKNKPYPQWFKSTFKNKVDALTPETPKTFLPDHSSGQAEALLSFPFIRHIVTEEIFKSEELEVRPEAKGGLHHKEHLTFYPVGHLVGLQERPTHV